jgi:hypothetical protein
MAEVPRTGNTPFVRTDFSDDQAWRAICEAAQAETEEGFRAFLSIVDDVGLDGASAADLVASAARAAHGLLLLADGMTMTHPDHPILCIDLLEGGRSVRVAPQALWSLENNLSLRNMDFEDFSGSTDADGIFRGFS